MSVVEATDSHLELAHVLFIDIVGYSKRLTNEQTALVKKLNEMVRQTVECRAAEADGKLIRLPTGDGMALAFFTSPDAPVRCAIELSKADQADPKLELRMGIHSGPVDQVSDVNERSNVAGAGINLAQRVMDCGDAGHILLSKRVADDLAQYAHWQRYLHDLGEVEVKHGVPITLANFYSDEVGNSELPSKVKQAQERLVAARRRKLSIIAGIFVAVLMLGGIAWLVAQQKISVQLSAVRMAEKGIAVLPFTNLSEEKENAYFADGIQDEILTHLARIAELKVISRTSVMQYKTGTTRNLREIAQQLGVAYLLEGSVQRAAQKVRVIAQLIDARTDRHVWAKTYDNPLDDVFAVQSEVAQIIAQQLKAQITPETKAAIEEKPTTDLVAYDYYLRGKQLWHDISLSKDWEADNRKAIDFLNLAVERDSEFALAYCLLVDLNLNLYHTVDRTPARRERANAALAAAMRAAPSAGETYLARCSVAMQDRDEEGGLELLSHAARLLPNNLDVLEWMAGIEMSHGQWDEAVRDQEKARQIDPRGPNTAIGLAGIYKSIREYTKCDQVADEAIAAFPNRPGYFLVAKVQSAFSRGDFNLARKTLAQLPEDWDPSGLHSELKVEIAAAERNFEEVKQLIASFDRNKISEIMRELAYLEALIARREGDKARSDAILLPLREAAEKELSERPKDSGLLSRTALLDAYLGRFEPAMREAEKSVELTPISRYATGGPWRVFGLAEVCMLAGDRDRAIQLLAEATAQRAGPSYGDFLMPYWDDLRGDPRFEKIVASLKPKDGR